MKSWIFMIIFFCGTCISGGEKLNLVLIGDTHQDHRNFTAAKAFIESVAEPKLVLSAGDLLCHVYPEGNPRNPPAFKEIRGGETLKEYDRKCFAELAQLKIAAAVPGNHEPDRGDAYFLELYRKSGIPLVAVAYPGIEREYVMAHGIAIVGFAAYRGIYPEWRDRSRTSPEKLIAAAQRARKAGAKAVVLLSHQMNAEDDKLAADPEFRKCFDLICGGDQHKFIPAPKEQEQVIPAGGEVIPILKSGSHFRGVGTAVLEFEHGKLTGIRLKNTLLELEK